MYNFFTYSMMFLHMFVGLILIGIILLQRGRGGGLAGAFGGMGGQSAFGNRAGDLFTRITVVLATVWIVLGCVCVLLASNSRTRSSKIQEFAAEVKEAPADEKAAGGAKGEDLPIPSPAKTPGATEEKPVIPGEAADPKKPDPTDKVEEGKKDVKPEEAAAKPDAAEEGAKKDVVPDSKEPAAEKPADPVKKAEEGAAAEKAVPEEKKPE